MFSDKGIVLLCFIFWSTTFLGGQDILTPIKDFCQPGVLHKSPSKGVALEYAYFPGYRMSSSSDASRVEGNHHFLAKFKVPILIKEKLKILAGARYFEEVYHLDNPAMDKEWLFYNIDGKKLKSTRFSAYLTRSFGYKHYLGLKAEFSYNGDYSSLVNFRKRYRETYLIGVLGRKTSEYREWGLGMVARLGYRGVVTYPFFIYNHTFNDKWGLQSTLPVKLMFRYRLNRSSLFLFGGEFASRNYSVDLVKGETGPNGNYRIRNPESQINLAYQHQLSKWIWAEIKTGYVHYLKSSVEGFREVSNVDFHIHKKDSAFLKLGLFLSPPASYLEDRK